MKHFIFVLALGIGFAIQASAQKKNIVREEYYLVTKDGVIDSSTITETRILKYKKGLLVSGERICNGEKTQLIFNHDPYNSLQKVNTNQSNVVKDANNRIIQQKQISGNVAIIHYYIYNDWGDVIEDKIIFEGDPDKKMTVFTYEYFYLSKFTYATNDDGVTAISGYIDDFHSPWLKRTVKQDGRIVQHINRKISTP